MSDPKKLTAGQILELFALGWDVIESDGSQMTIQAPEDWEEPGERELVIDTKEYLL